MTLETNVAEDEYGGAFAVEIVENDGSLVPIGGVAAKNARQLDDVPQLAEQCRNYSRSAYLKPAGREPGPRGRYLYDIGGVLLAGVLKRFTELGVSSAGLRTVSLAATAWSAEDLELLRAAGATPETSPIAQLLKFYAAGSRRFHVELRSVAPREGGEVAWAARLICADADQCTAWTRPIDGLETRATVLVGLDEVIARLGATKVTAH